MTKSIKDETLQDGSDASSTNELNALIGKQVLRSMGSPTDVFKVRVHPVGSDRYRVNVLTGKDAASARITNSFFLTADGTGKILSSSPEIARPS